MIPNPPVRQLMSTDVVSIDINAPLSTVRKLLEVNRFHHVPVLEDGVVVGVLSSVDIARVALNAYVTDARLVDAHLDAAFSVRQVMTPDPIVVVPDDSVHLAAERLGDGDIHCLPVVDHARRLVGMLTSTDLVRFLYART